MALFLLDTTTLSHIRYDHPQVIAAHANHSHTSMGHQIGVASINVEEVIGVLMALLQNARTPQQQVNASRLLNETVMFLSKFALYPNTEIAITRFDQHP